MHNRLVAKRKLEEFCLKKIAKGKRIIKAKLQELTERERKYKISSERLLNASRDAREIYSGISGFELKERNGWGERAMYLRHFSEEKLKVIKTDLARLRSEDDNESAKLLQAKNKLSKINLSIRKNLQYGNIEKEIEAFDELNPAIPRRNLL